MGYRKRIVVPGAAHHVTQRGSRRLNVFFCDEDRELYLELFKHYTKKYDVLVLDYCLMNNHVHHALVPPDKEALAKTLQPVHRQYAEQINRRMGWSGHLWQERFYSGVVDPEYFWVMIRYIAQNPVVAEMVKYPWDYRWSGAAAHCGIREDDTLSLSPYWEKIFRSKRDLHTWLCKEEDPKMIQTLLDNTSRDLPSGSLSFLEQLEKSTGLPTTLKTPGRKRKMPTR
jgi:putative transposase